MIYSPIFTPRLVGVPCAQTQKAIVEQIKRMASYKVRNLTRNIVFLGRTVFHWLLILISLYCDLAWPNESDPHPGPPHISSWPDWDCWFHHDPNISANGLPYRGQSHTHSLSFVNDLRGLCYKSREHALFGVQGTSVSEFWYSLFDNGTNYCNLRNVMQGTRGVTHSYVGCLKIELILIK